MGWTDVKLILVVFILLIAWNSAFGDDRKCLTENIYFEARGQGQAGWLAVAQVTQNRVDDKRFPNTVCYNGKWPWKGPKSPRCTPLR